MDDPSSSFSTTSAEPFVGRESVPGSPGILSVLSTGEELVLPWPHSGSESVADTSLKDSTVPSSEVGLRDGNASAPSSIARAVLVL